MKEPPGAAQGPQVLGVRTSPPPFDGRSQLRRRGYMMNSIFSTEGFKVSCIEDT